MTGNISTYVSMINGYYVIMKIIAILNMCSLFLPLNWVAFECLQDTIKWVKGLFYFWCKFFFVISTNFHIFSYITKLASGVEIKTTKKLNYFIAALPKGHSLVQFTQKKALYNNDKLREKQLCKRYFLPKLQVNK